MPLREADGVEQMVSNRAPHTVGPDVVDESLPPTPQAYRPVPRLRCSAPLQSSLPITVERCSVAAQGVYYTSAEAGGHQAPDGPESGEEHTHTSLGQCRAPNPGNIVYDPY